MQHTTKQSETPGVRERQSQRDRAQLYKGCLKPHATNTENAIYYVLSLKLYEITVNEDSQVSTQIIISLSVHCRQYSPRTVRNLANLLRLRYRDTIHAF